MGIVIHWYPDSLMSLDRNSYLALFLSAAALIPEVKGMVSSIKVTDAGSLRRSTRIYADLEGASQRRHPQGQHKSQNYLVYFLLKWSKDEPKHYCVSIHIYLRLSCSC